MYIIDDIFIYILEEKFIKNFFDSSSRFPTFSHVYVPLRIRIFPSHILFEAECACFRAQPIQIWVILKTTIKYMAVLEMQHERGGMNRADGRRLKCERKWALQTWQRFLVFRQNARVYLWFTLFSQYGNLHTLRR